MSLDELSQDPFDVDEFVERLAWRSSQVKIVPTEHPQQSVDLQSFPDPGESSSGSQQQFDPMILHGAFCQTIQQITDYARKLEQKAQTLETQCIEEEGFQRKKVHDLLKENQVPVIIYLLVVSNYELFFHISCF